MSMSSSTPLTRKAWEEMFEVFVSFRGEDTLRSFTLHLLASLRNARITVFSNDDLTKTGPMKIIEYYKISVIVFSRNYADSAECLQELEKIMECQRTIGQVVMPVFYDVDPLEVRHQIGKFGEAFEKLLNTISTVEDKVLRWRTALRDASFIPGIVVGDSRNESEDIGNIVELVIRLLGKTDLSFPDYPVGIEFHVQDVIRLLNSQQSIHPLFLGIWGKGGIGKTTFAKTIYNRIGHKFAARSFLDVREFWQRNNGQVFLQELLLFDVFKTIIKTGTVESGRVILKEKLRQKKIFLVLDDVNKFDQLNALCGSREWFGQGSVIIITTSDENLLSQLGVDRVDRMKEMDKNTSLHLFSRHAFKQASPTNRFAGLSGRVVEYTGGLPLVLQVLGSFLFFRGMKKWNNALEKLKMIPHDDVLGKLRISFDDLRDEVKQIFLDIALFLIGMVRDDAIKMFNGFGLSVASGISVLIQKSLVTTDNNNRLGMHFLLRDMARQIVEKETRIQPEPRIFEFDVFLSFRGKDTRASFTSHLYTSLQNAGIYTFKDDDEIQRGELISISLLKAIGSSRIAVIVLSRNYANSRWCMTELEIIMKNRRTMGQVIVPVFYGVDPSEVRHQTGKFGEAFEDLKRGISMDENKEKSWRIALLEVGGIAGFVVIDSRNESEAIKNIVENVTRLLDKTDLFIADNPVGVESRVQDVIRMLENQQSNDVLLLGIWGMGGIGKTTIAKAIYNKIGCNFEGRCFLAHIREVWEQDAGQVCLQEQLLFDIYKKATTKIHSVESGKNILKERLCHKSILLVLDDVNKLDQLNALCANRKWFGSGSRIIITTRDKHILRGNRVDQVYIMKEMDECESNELFSWHAFKKASPREDFTGLSKDVIAYSGGLPLALEVLGSYLFDREVAEWKSVLEKLKRIPNDQIQKKLKISYDALDDDTEKEIFLDLACFFNGMDRNDVIHILNGCGLFAEIGISVLIERSLVTVDDKNKLGMHDLVRDMGREIIREESPKEPGERSRLWSHEDVLDVLSQQTGTKVIEGLALMLPRTNTKCLNTKAFKKMKRLRLLQLAGVKLEGDFEYLSRNLRWLCWHGFPSTCIPTNFYQGGLVSFELENSNVKQVWKEAQFMEKLTILNLSHSHYLTQTPDFSNLPNLEKLVLADCRRLSEVSHTIGHLNKVLLINLKDCISLRKLPRSIYKLESLKTLILSGCLKIDKLEEDLEQMRSLTSLMADNTAITRVPFSVVRSKSIAFISLCGYEGLSRDVFPSIIWSWMSPTNNLSSLAETSAAMSSLVSLDVPDSSSYDLSSFSKDLPKLRILWVECGSELQLSRDAERILDTLFATNSKELESSATTSEVSNMKNPALIQCCSPLHISGSKNSVKSLLIQMGMDCQDTNILKERILQNMTISGNGGGLLPGDNYPHWLTFNCEGSSVIFEIPRVNGRILKTMLCIVHSSDPYNITSDGLKNVLVINYTKTSIQLYKRDALASFEDEEWQRLVSNIEPGNKVGVVLVFGNELIVKKTAVYLIYDEPSK